MPLGGKSRRYQVLDQQGRPLGEISRRQYERLAYAERTGSSTGTTQYAQLSKKAQGAGYANYSEYRRLNKQYANRADRWINRMYTAGVPEGKLGRFSRARYNAILVEQARQQLPRDRLGDRNDRDDTTGILNMADPDSPLFQLLLDMGYVDRDDAEHYF